MVIDKDDPEFKAEWNKAIAVAEKSLLKTLQTHLSKVIRKATDKIRQSAKKSIAKIKTIRGQPAAREQIEQVVREANDERCKRNEATEKRKLEASNNGKRNKQK